MNPDLCSLQNQAPQPTFPTWLGPCHLSEDVTGQRLIQVGVAVDECKEVKARAMLLHHELEEALVLEYIQDLGRDNPVQHCPDALETV